MSQGQSELEVKRLQWRRKIDDLFKVVATAEEFFNYALYGISVIDQEGSIQEVAIYVNEDALLELKQRQYLSDDSSIVFFFAPSEMVPLIDNFLMQFDPNDFTVIYDPGNQEEEYKDETICPNEIYDQGDNDEELSDSIAAAQPKVYCHSDLSNNYRKVKCLCPDCLRRALCTFFPHHCQVCTSPISKCTAREEADRIYFRKNRENER